MTTKIKEPNNKILYPRREKKSSLNKETTGGHETHIVVQEIFINETILTSLNAPMRGKTLVSFFM